VLSHRQGRPALEPEELHRAAAWVQLLAAEVSWRGKCYLAAGEREVQPVMAAPGFLVAWSKL